MSYSSYYNDFISNIYIYIYIYNIYINEEWAVGDVWNSQNIPKAKQKSGGFMSYLFGDPDQKLQVENGILSRQLEESKQEIILARRRADRDIEQAYSRIKETERTLQAFIERHQQEIQQYNTRLQETQSQLQESDTRLQQANTGVQEMHHQIQVIIIKCCCIYTCNYIPTFQLIPI